VTPRGNGASARSEHGHEEPLKAVIYLRVSTKDQATRGGEAEGFSIPAQRDACQRKATTLGAVVVEEFVDRGESARSARRPELQRMLAYVAANPVHLAIVHKIDRLARNRVDDVEINLELTRAGVTLVSCTENIDETPSGMLLHGIMSSIAEFYSRNLANEVIKGSMQKVLAGGTSNRVPIGYLNVRRIESGREIRTVELDPERAPLIQWAFQAYATGGWTTRGLLAELTERGLRSRETATYASQPLHLSNIQSLLRHPFYRGVVRYKGAEYPGRHEPLVDEATWRKVQDVLNAKDRSGEKTREHPHYLKGSLYCHCGFRMIVSYSRNRHGTVYPYFCCLGRHGKHNSCTKKAVLIKVIEDRVQELYSRVQLAPDLRKAIELTLVEELEAISEEVTLERTSLQKRHARLQSEQTKLLQAHYAGAVPVHLLKSEQDRLEHEIGQTAQRLEALDANIDATRSNLAGALDFAANGYKAYTRSGPKHRRELNQFLFKRLIVENDNTITAELNELFAILLSPQIANAATSRTPATARRHPTKRDPGTNKPRRPVSRRGLNYELMVGGTGLEPVTPSLSSWCSPN
jgi:site-specific DNA recombinase